MSNTKQRIIEIARNLFANHSYPEVSMEDIARPLNVSKAAIYYHFKSKAEIYLKTVETVFDDLQKHLKKTLKEKDHKERLGGLIKHYLSFALKEKNLIVGLTTNSSWLTPQAKKKVFSLKERVSNLIVPTVEQIQKKKRIEKVDSRFLTSLLLAMMDGLILRESFLNKKVECEKWTQEIIAALF